MSYLFEMLYKDNLYFYVGIELYLGFMLRFGIMDADLYLKFYIVGNNV